MISVLMLKLMSKSTLFDSDYSLLFRLPFLANLKSFLSHAISLKQIWLMMQIQNRKDATKISTIAPKFWFLGEEGHPVFSSNKVEIRYQRITRWCISRLIIYISLVDWTIQDQSMLVSLTSMQDGSNNFKEIKQLLPSNRSSKFQWSP